MEIADSITIDTCILPILNKVAWWFAVERYFAELAVTLVQTPITPLEDRMPRILLPVLLIMLASSVLAAQDDPKRPESLKEKASYILGRDVVKDFQERLVDFDLEQLIAGIRSAAAGQPSVLTDEDVDSVMKTFGRELEKRQQQHMQELADKNMRAGQAFMKENALKEGVKQLENGLQFEVLEPGEGDSPKVTDRVKVHFIGKSLDGKIFESTKEEKDPPTVAVGGIGVRGVLEALLRMEPGAKWRVVVPPELAYGVAGAMPEIGPNQTLIFEIEFFEVVK